MLDKKVDSDIDAVKNPKDRILLRVLCIAVASLASVVVYLFNTNSKDNQSERNDCRSENRILRRENDSLKTAAQIKSMEYNDRLERKVERQDSIINVINNSKP